MPVYALPRMCSFLQNNGPWSQLVKLGNISVLPMKADSLIRYDDGFSVSAFLVPHRDEFSETAGFLLSGRHRKALYIPDIDKWSKWDRNIMELIKKVDYAFIDGTFYDAAEIPNRNMSEIPHPFVVETMELLKGLSPKEKNKVWFIHLNHSNPLLDTLTQAYRQVRAKGFNVAAKGSAFQL
jgi:pyrroloquinoline quinone biosynthesis protein B